MSNINRPILWCAQPGIVTGETTKRGKAFLSVHLDSGRDLKVAFDAVSFSDVDTFSQPTGVVTFTARDRDYYGTQRNMFARR